MLHTTTPFYSESTRTTGLLGRENNPTVQHDLIRKHTARRTPTAPLRSNYHSSRPTGSSMPRLHRSRRLPRTASGRRKSNITRREKESSGGGGAAGKERRLPRKSHERKAFVSPWGPSLYTCLRNEHDVGRETSHAKEKNALPKANRHQGWNEATILFNISPPPCLEGPLACPR